MTPQVAVIGAGTMGSEIVYTISSVGIPVVLKDVDMRFVKDGIEKAKSIYQFKVKRRRMSLEEMEKRIALIIPAITYEKFGNIDFAIECITENIELKKNVFNELDAICSPRTILATNTSALSITEIATATKRPEKVVGMHFFNPASMLKLVEVIKATRTSERTIETTCEFVEKLGKIPVKITECAGFVVNRLLCTGLIEAIKCVESGFASQEEIDRAMISPDGGLPVGLFKMADQLGLDLVLKVMKTLETGYGQRFKIPQIILKLVSEGKLGVKTGEGFYLYNMNKSVSR